jgi:hypothetical protein
VTRCRWFDSIARLVVLGSCSLSAQRSDDPAAVLARARERVLQTVQNLPRYTCIQTVDRRIFKADHAPRMPDSCDDLIAQKRRGLMPVVLVATDRLRLNVAVGENGREIYSWAGDDRLESSRLDSLVATGPLGTGPFGPLLIDTFGQAAIAFNFRSSDEYWYRVPKDMSHYRLQIGGAGRNFAYDGKVHIDPQTADLKDMTARTGELPWESGVCEATTLIDFQRIRIGEGEYLLPRESRLRFTNRAGGESENTTSYSSCHEFHAEAALRFDEPERVSSYTAHTTASLAPLSAGIPMFLSLDTPIDTETAAAGDAVTAKLRSAISDKGSGRRFPTGSLVRGRIKRLERHIETPQYFLIAVEFRSIETDGKQYPLAARFSRQMQKENQLPFSEEKQDYFAVRSKAHQLPTDSFVFESKAAHYAMPRGFVMDWITN